MGIPSGIGGQVGLAEEVYVNEVQQISGTPSATFGLSYDGYSGPVSLATNATAAAIQAYLEAFPNIGTGGVSCTGGALPTAVVVTFQGALVTKRNVPALAVQGAITGLTFSTTTPGTGYGDYAAPTRFLEFETEGLVEQANFIRSGPGIRAGARYQRADRIIRDPTGIAGPLGGPVQSKGWGLPLKYAIGSVVISTPVGGTLTRDQTLTPGDPCNSSLTIQKGVPLAECGAGNVDPESFLGCRVLDWELSCTLGDLLKLAMTIDGQTLDQTQALAAASYPTGQEDLTFIRGLITLDGANVDVTDFSIRSTNAQKTDRRFIRNSSLKKQPILNARGEPTGKFTMEWNSHSRAIYAKNRAGSTCSFTALFEGSVIEGALRYGVLITVPSLILNGAGPSINGPDIVMIDMPFEVLDDGTNPVITVRYRSTDTAS